MLNNSSCWGCKAMAEIWSEGDSGSSHRVSHTTTLLTSPSCSHCLTTVLWSLWGGVNFASRTNWHHYFNIFLPWKLPHSKQIYIIKRKIKHAWGVGGRFRLWLLFQKKWVQFLAPTWHLTTVYNSSYRGSDTLKQTCMQAKHHREKKLKLKH